MAVVNSSELFDMTIRKINMHNRIMLVTAPNEPAIPRYLVPDVVIIISLFLASFVLEIILAFAFYDHGLLTYGALFNTDPWKFIPIVAHGEGSPTFRHPLLQTFFSQPVAISAQIVASIMPDNPDKVALREPIILFLTPALSGLKAAALYVLFGALGMKRWPAIIVSCLGVVSFSQVIYGAVPDHFAVSGALLTFVFLLGAFAVIDKRFNHFALWIPLGIVATGVTITNVAIVAIVYAAVQLRYGVGIIRVISRSAVLGVLVIAVTLAVSYWFAGMNWYGVAGTASQEWPTGEFVRDDPTRIVRAAAKYPAIVGYSIFGGTPVFYERELYDGIVVDYDPKLYPAEIMFGLSMLGVVLGGLIFWWRHSVASRWLALAAAASLIFNGFLLAVYGGQLDYIVFSQHWHASLMILVAGWAVAPSAVRSLSMGVFAISVFVCMMGGANLVSDIFSTIPARSGAYFSQDPFDL